MIGPLALLFASAASPPAEVVAHLRDAFDAQLLDEADDRVVFRHQLVHDAIYRHVPAPGRRLLHREAATALNAGGASLLDVADHLVLGSERGEDAATVIVAAGPLKVAAPSTAVCVVPWPLNPAATTTGPTRSSTNSPVAVLV